MQDGNQLGASHSGNFLEKELLRKNILRSISLVDKKGIVLAGLLIAEFDYELAVI